LQDRVVGLVCGVFDRGDDVFPLERRIIGEDFLEGSTCRQKLKDVGHTDAQAANALWPAGLPNFTTVGLPDAALRESRERIKSAIKNCGLEFPFQNSTVNLAPADVKKEGSGFDLPIALGILGTTGVLLKTDPKNSLFLGELSLDGGLRPIKGALSTAAMARQKAIQRMVTATTGSDPLRISGA
jgi:hypothetical protein